MHASEREATIVELTKQIGALEMQNRILEKYKNCSYSENKWNSMVMNAKFAAQESELTKLKHEIELKEQEINMVKSYQKQLACSTAVKNDIQSLNIGKLDHIM